MGEGIIVLDKSGRVVEHIAYRNRSGTCEEVDWAIPPLRTNGVLGKRPLYPEKYEGPTPAVGDECLILDWPTWEANHKAEFYLAILLNLFIFYYENGIIEIRMQFLRKVMGTTFLIPPLDFMDTTHVIVAKVTVADPMRKQVLVDELNKTNTFWVDKDGNNMKKSCRCLFEKHTSSSNIYKDKIKFDFSRDPTKQHIRLKFELDEPLRAGPAARTEPVLKSLKLKANAAGGGVGAAGDRHGAALGGGGGGSGGGSAGGRRNVARARSASRTRSRQERRLEGDSTGGPGGGSGRGRPSPGGGNRERVAARLRRLMAAESSVPSVDIVGQLTALAALHDAGSIDDDEFTAAKKFLLDMP